MSATTKKRRARSLPAYERLARKYTKTKYMPARMDLLLKAPGFRWVSLTWELYRTRDGWRWRAKTRNGRIVGASTESYRRARAAILNARLFGAPSRLSGLHPKVKCQTHVCLL